MSDPVRLTQKTHISLMRPFFRPSNVWRIAGLALLAAAQFVQANVIHAGPIHGSDLSIAGIVAFLSPTLIELAARFRGGSRFEDR